MDQQSADYGKDLTNSVTQYFRQSADVCGCREEERFPHSGPCIIRSIGNICLFLINCRSLLKDSYSCRTYDPWCVSVGGVFPDNASSGNTVSTDLFSSRLATSTGRLAKCSFWLTWYILKGMYLKPPSSVEHSISFLFMAQNWSNLSATRQTMKNLFAKPLFSFKSAQHIQFHDNVMINLMFYIRTF